MSETEKEEEETQFKLSPATRLRLAAEKMERKGEEMAENHFWEEALDYYELAGYLKAAAKMIEENE